MKEADDEITRLLPALDEDRLEAARFGLHRIFLLETLMSDQLRLLETLAPIAYFRIRAGLGHGSGLESSRVQPADPQLEEGGGRLRARLPAAPDERRGPGARARLEPAVCSPSPRRWSTWTRPSRASATGTSRWCGGIIGQGTPSLKGNPIELLEKNVRFQFFPVLWAAREALFAQFQPGELKT